MMVNILQGPTYVVGTRRTYVPGSPSWKRKPTKTQRHIWLPLTQKTNKSRNRRWKPRNPPSHATVEDSPASTSSTALSLHLTKSGDSSTTVKMTVPWLNQAMFRTRRMMTVSMEIWTNPLTKSYPMNVASESIIITICPSESIINQVHGCSSQLLSLYCVWIYYYPYTSITISH